MAVERNTEAAPRPSAFPPLPPANQAMETQVAKRLGRHQRRHCVLQRVAQLRGHFSRVHLRDQSPRQRGVRYAVPRVPDSV